MVELEVPKMPQVLSPSNSRRRSNDSNSPEFEFWMVRNPSFPQPDLHSADELFSGGVILPLHQLHHQSPDPPPPPPTPQEEESSQHESIWTNSARPGTESGSGPDFSAAISNLSASGFTSSKRWKDIFKKSDKKGSSNGNDDVNENSKEKVQEKVKKKEKRNLAVGGGGGGGGGMAVAELNINLWPFRRTRSAGNGGNRPRNSSAATTRKTSSAPCSRSNSAGESKSRKWPSSPARGGVHLGRSSPIWQVRRSTAAAAAGGGGGRCSGIVGNSAEKGTRKHGNYSGKKIPAASVSGGGGGGGGQKGKILSLNVPMCIGYRSQLSCRIDEKSDVGEAAAGGGGSGGGGCSQGDGGESMEGVRGGNLFNIRSLFSKKVY